MVVDPESKRKGIETLVKVGVIGVGLAIVGPYVWMAVEGLMAVAIFGGAALLLWGLAPAVATYVANKRIALLKAAIEANPIETMEALFEDKKQELAKQGIAVEEVATQVRNVDGLVKGLEKTDPDEAKDYVDVRDKLREGLDEVSNEYSDADNALKEFGKQIDKARRIWKVAIAINRALDVSAKARAEVFADIKKQVAFDKVTNDLNRSFARLDTAVARRKGLVPKSAEPLALNPAPQVIDLTAVKGSRVTINR